MRLALAPLLLLLMGATDPRDHGQRLLAAHNLERARLGIAPLIWDDGLARDAARWAETLASRNAFEHAPQNKQGENLWTGTAARYAPEEMVGSWIEERALFRHGPLPRVSTTGRFEDVGHYTQLIWAKTQRLGCAIARNAEDDVLVCRYHPAGNVMGQWPYALKKVPPPVSKKRRRGG
jgi:hypothetical protein